MSTKEEYGGLFVGRRQEMSLLEVALDDTLAGQGRLVTLAGDVGIGKTRTAQELAGYAERRGARVLWGRCHDAQGTPPYWPWVQPIRSYVQQRAAPELGVEMGAGAIDIAEVVPEVHERLRDLRPAPSVEPEQARFRLFDAVTAFLKRAAQTTPLVLILEDLHWADTPSLLLLEFFSHALAEAPLLVLGTYRDVELTRTHPLAHSLGELARHPFFREIFLQGLARQDVQQFIAAATGVEPPQALVQAVYLRTEGNPFFMTQVVQWLVQQGHHSLARWAGEQAGSLDIPHSVRMVIERRLARLSEACHQTLRVAAVIGREFDCRLLPALLDGLPESRLLEVLDEALAAHVLEELTAGTERYQFSHVLIQQTLANGVSPSRRIRLHARIAEALETLCLSDLEAHAAELAYHCAQAEPVLGTAKLVRYAAMAGERALATSAYEEAMLHFQRALAAKAGQAMDGETAVLLFGLGRAQGALGAAPDAWATLGRAFDYCETVGDVAMAVAIAEYPLLVVPGLPRVTHLVERALALVPPESRQAGRLLARYGLLLNLETGDYGRTQAVFNRALAIAQRERDLALEMRTLAAAADADHYHLRWSEVLEKSGRAIALARQAQDPHAEVWPHYLAACTLLSAMGDAAGACHHGATMRELAEQLRHRGFLTTALVMSALVAQTTGDWHAARALYDRGLAIAPYHFGVLAYRAVLEYELGEVTQGEALLERLLHITRQTAPGPTGEFACAAFLPPFVARLTGVVSHFDLAEAAAATFLSSPAATPLFGSMARTGVALMAVQQGNVAAAAEQYAVLQSQCGAMLPGGIMAIDRVLGLLAVTLGTLDQAMDHFAYGLALCGKAGYRPEYAWLCCDYAEALLQRQGPADRSRASALLDEALASSQELGMRPLVQRVVALQHRLEAQPVAAPAYPDGLTAREVEVLCLIAAGKRNREIADALYISLNTVARHVNHVFTKTGVANRAEAAMYAARHGLVA